MPKTLSLWFSILGAALAAAADSGVTATPPPELFSPLIGQKFLATAQTHRSPAQYPQWTDRNTGAWDWFSPDTWTSGFLPVAMYALNTRASLCPSAGLNSTNWVTLGQTWSAAEVPLETNNTLGHDVGFVSFPFVEEITLCVTFPVVCEHED